MTGVATASVVVFGHSHLTCLQNGYEAAQARGVNSVEAEFFQIWGKYDPFVRQDGDHPIYHPDMVAELKARAGRTRASAFVASLIGSEHLIWAVEGQLRPFDVILPYAASLSRNPDAEIVPYTALRAQVRDTISPILKFAGWLQKEMNIPVLLVAPPPPVASDAMLLNRSHGHLNELMKRLGVPHWTIRYKLWRIWIEIAAAVTGEDGVKFVGVPNFVTDARGLLHPDYCHDCVHGNADYGYMAWLKILPNIDAGSG
jgi:hypothetical protein